LISIPSLFGGFSGDDLIQRLTLEGRIPDYRLGIFELYDFTPPNMPARDLIDLGMFPWFTGPELSLRFFRPLSSASLALDHVLFGRSPVLSHLQSWLWVVLMAIAAASLYQRWFSRGAALASALVFGLSTAHGTPTAWLASRHTLLGASFGVFALWAWVKWREDEWRPGALLGSVFLLCSLLASESGLVAVLLLACHELATRGLRRGWAGAAPFVLLGLAYLAFYVAFGYGAEGSSFYISPFATPLAYLRVASWSIPALCTELLVGVPSALASFVPELRGAYVVLGIGAAAAVGGIVFAGRNDLPKAARRTCLWLAAASFLGLFALVGAPVTGRVLPLPAFGAAAIAGNALWLAWTRARRQLPEAGSLHPGRSDAPAAAAGRRPVNLWWAAVGILALLQLGVSPLLRMGVAFQFRKMALDQRELAERADVGVCRDRGFLYLLTGADPSVSLYAAAAVLFYTPDKGGAERWRVLAMAPQTLRLERPGPNRVALEVLDLPRRQNPFEQLYRSSDDPLREGSRVDLGELAVRVAAVEGGAFNRAEFDFRRELESMPTCWLAWSGGRLGVVPLPKVGESVTVAYEPGPMGI
jgi:hypothetical protein